jgi:hypothetical protein
MSSPSPRPGALDAAGVVFTPDNGSGPGVALRKAVPLPPRAARLPGGLGPGMASDGAMGTVHGVIVRFNQWPFL